MRKIIEGIKDDKGRFIKIKVDDELVEPPMDSILKRILFTVEKTVTKIEGELTKSGMPDKVVIDSMEKCALLLMKLKKDEEDILSGMSDEELKKLLKK